MTEEKAYWLWYPDDFEHYHAMKQNFSRSERGCGWPAFWKSEGFRHRVVFRRTYDLEAETTFTVLAVREAVGYVQTGEAKRPFGETVTCGPGRVGISVHVGCIGHVLSVFVSGGLIRSDGGWTVEDYDAPPVPAAFNRYFTDPARDPSEWPFTERPYEPASVEEISGGVLYGFETELTAALEVLPAGDAPADPPVYLGESRAEALDREYCYFRCRPDPASGRCPRQALRYAFLPDCRPGDYRVRAIHQYIDIPVRAYFRSSDGELDRIFAVAAHTFSLCSGVFFLDGIKRDKWIWGGDAYQSLFVNRYLTADAEIERRTLTALRGNDPVTTHVNTITDYSLLWLLGVEAYFESYGDMAYVEHMLPKMESLLALCLSQREKHGFLVGRERDWVFVDWADFDRDGPLCAEQLLLAEGLRAAARFAPPARAAEYLAIREALLAAIETFFWDEELGAYIDSFTSGKRHVTRHAAVFAILFDIADDARKERLARTVLFSQKVPPITTPYFRFFELEALCRLGYLDYVLGELRAYWGGMLRLGAVTFWEEFDPAKPLEEQYEMYGDPFGKSLCHAWAASPIYLLARYFVGLRPLEPGGRRYEVKPRTEFFTSLDCAFPMGGRLVRIRLTDGVLTVTEEPPD